MVSAALPQGVDTKYLLEGPGCLPDLPPIISQINNASRPLLLIQDRNTKDAAGQKLAAVLTGQGIPFSELVLEDGPLGIVDTDYARAAEIREIIKAQNVFPVAVGSGTINDLVKRAAFELEVPYVCVATAASVDGYCSFGSSLVYEGFKTTLPCPAPAAVAADTEILASAPYDMTTSGYGDLYAKLAGGVDWFLADRLGIEKIHDASWDLVQKDLPLWLAAPGKLKGGDTETLLLLFRGLTMSGAAMQVYKDSRPASGAEHLISHVWEMEHLSSNGVPLSHGFKVALGTVITVSMMEAFYSLPPENISVEACRPFRESWEERQASIGKRFPNPALREMIEKPCREKWIDDDQWAARIKRLAQVLPELRAFAKKRLGSKEKVREDLQKAGCPVSPEAFGITREKILDVVTKAQMIRKRYTILDALYETGQLGNIVERRR